MRRTAVVNQIRGLLLEPEAKLIDHRFWPAAWTGLQMELV